jgi:hypothetical protein
VGGEVHAEAARGAEIGALPEIADPVVAAHEPDVAPGEIQVLGN